VADFNSLARDSSDDGFHEIQLSGKQLVFLFMATTVVSVVIFLCGVLVGRGVRAERAAEIPDPAAALAPAPTDTVAEAEPVATAEPPTPPAESVDADPPPVPQPETEKPEAAVPPPSRPREKTAPAATAARTPAPPADVPGGQPASKTRASAPAPSTRGTWVVQIVALRDRGMASSIVERLSGKGYPAFLVNPTAGTPAPVFKVQVGRYADRDEAELVARRLEKEEQFKPWVSR